MSERFSVRWRRLPEGEFREAQQTLGEDRFFELHVTGPELPLGSLLEIERGSTLYWGEVRQVKDSTSLVWIEHCLDRSQLEPIREIWGD